jgi:hypothetical protein
MPCIFAPYLCQNMAASQATTSLPPSEAFEAKPGRVVARDAAAVGPVSTCHKLSFFVNTIR